MINFTGFKIPHAIVDRAYIDNFLQILKLKGYKDIRISLYEDLLMIDYNTDKIEINLEDFSSDYRDFDLSTIKKMKISAAINLNNIVALLVVYITINGITGYVTAVGIESDYKKYSYLEKETVEEIKHLLDQRLSKRDILWQKLLSTHKHLFTIPNYLLLFFVIITLLNDQHLYAVGGLFFLIASLVGLSKPVVFKNA